MSIAQGKRCAHSPGFGFPICGWVRKIGVMEESVALLQGFAIGGGLIIAIGAQNAFVLRQALARQHVLLVVLFCAVTDAVLVTLGAIGLHLVVQTSETALILIAFGGAGFLFWHGLAAARRALHPSVLEPGSGCAQTARQALAMVAGVTLLNPHVYLDTMVFIGGISASYPPTVQHWFVAGVILSSFAWFFSLGYGARALRPLFGNPKAWRVLDTGIAAVMCLVAAQLLIFAGSLMPV